MKKFLPPSIKGFTLIELLIVVVIIAVLSAIGYAVYANLGLQAKVRNAKRRADIDAISKALEVNRNETGYRALADSQFSNGFIPQRDPSDANYCATRFQIPQTDPLPLPADPVSSWGQSCGGGISDKWRVVNGGYYNGAPFPDGPNPPNGTRYWKICAWLEVETNPNVSAKAYCRVNAQ